MSARLSAITHTILLTIAIVLAYWWLHTPSLVPYSLQAFALTVILYFLVKILSKKKFWHVLPTALSIETALATFAFLLLIGATGNTASWFYPLTYIHLFFIVFSSQVGTSILATMMIIIFHYGLSPDLAQHELVSLSTLPIVMIFFIFAKQQHEEVSQERLIIDRDEQEIEILKSEELQLENFLQNFLRPKLDQLSQLLNYPQNLKPIKGQINLIKIEIERLLHRIKNQKTNL